MKNYRFLKALTALAMTVGVAGTAPISVFAEDTKAAETGVAQNITALITGVVNAGTDNMYNKDNANGLPMRVSENTILEKDPNTSEDMTGTITFFKYQSENGVSNAGEGIPQATENHTTSTGGETEAIDESSSPLAGVTFTYKKVGTVVQYTADATTEDVDGVSYGTKKGATGAYYDVDADFIKEIEDLTGTHIMYTTVSVGGKIQGTDGKLYAGDDLNDALKELNEEDSGTGKTNDSRQEDLEQWTKAEQDGTTAKTDDNGYTKVSDLDLGLYIVCEDARNAWDPESGEQAVVRDATPFLVSLPMTNVADIEMLDATSSEGGDLGTETFKAGSVWQYDVYVYPKNTMGFIHKDIVATNNDKEDSVISYDAEKDDNAKEGSAKTTQGITSDKKSAQSSQDGTTTRAGKEYGDNAEAGTEYTTQNGKNPTSGEKNDTTLSGSDSTSAAAKTADGSKDTTGYYGETQNNHDTYEEFTDKSGNRAVNDTTSTETTSRDVNLVHTTDKNVGDTVDFLITAKAPKLNQMSNTNDDVEDGNGSTVDAEGYVYTIPWATKATDEAGTGSDYVDLNGDGVVSDAEKDAEDAYVAIVRKAAIKKLEALENYGEDTEMNSSAPTEGTKNSGKATGNNSASYAVYDTTTEKEASYDEWYKDYPEYTTAKNLSTFFTKVIDKADAAFKTYREGYNDGTAALAATYTQFEIVDNATDGIVYKVTDDTFEEGAVNMTITAGKNAWNSAATEEWDGTNSQDVKSGENILLTADDVNIEWTVAAQAVVNDGSINGKGDNTNSDAAGTADTVMSNQSGYISQANYENLSGTVQDDITAVKQSDTLKNGFKLTFTESGLKKLSALTQSLGDVNVYIHYTGIVSELTANDTSSASSAKAAHDTADTVETNTGAIKEEKNAAILYFQTNVSNEKVLESNEVYIYTYEIDVTKEFSHTGTIKYDQVAFSVQAAENDDRISDINNAMAFKTNGYTADGSADYIHDADDLDTTDAGEGVENTETLGKNLLWVKESDGVYHLYDSLSGLDAGKEIVEFVHPESETGKLVLKGVDARTYVLTEETTVPGYNLLSDKIVIGLNQTSPEDGTLDSAWVKTGDVPTAEILTAAQAEELGECAFYVQSGEGESQMDSLNNGVFELHIYNNEAITTIRTGGIGWNAALIAAGLGVVLFVIVAAKRKKDEEASAE